MTFDEIPSINWNNYEDNRHGNIAIMTGNRKRSRDDESCEFMPLSKRINNLHINNNLGNASGAQIQNSSHTVQADGMLHQNQQEPSTSAAERQPNYDPGPNCSQSIYYLDNKLLFELHLQRIQRSGQQFPF